MKKSLFDTTCSEATLQRIAALTADRAPRWGSMDAAKMLQHCRIVNEAILSEPAPTHTPTLKERILKTLVVYFIKRLPKNAKQPARIQAAGALRPVESFEQEREKMILSVKKFLAHQAPIVSAHPIFGRMNTAEWGRFSWIHLNHHLTQFGV